MPVLARSFPYAQRTARSGLTTKSEKLAAISSRPWPRRAFPELSSDRQSQSSSLETICSRNVVFRAYSLSQRVDNQTLSALYNPNPSSTSPSTLGGLFSFSGPRLLYSSRRNSFIFIFPVLEIYDAVLSTSQLVLPPRPRSPFFPSRRLLSHSNSSLGQQRYTLSAHDPP